MFAGCCTSCAALYVLQADVQFVGQFVFASCCTSAALSVLQADVQVCGTSYSAG